MMSLLVGARLFHYMTQGLIHGRQGDKGCIERLRKAVVSGMASSGVAEFFLESRQSQGELASSVDDGGSILLVHVCLYPLWNTALEESDDPVSYAGVFIPLTLKSVPSCRTGDIVV